MSDKNVPGYDRFEPVTHSKGPSFEKVLLNSGLALGTGVLGYMLYKFRTTKERVSVHLIHTRLAVQGTIVTFITVAGVYHAMQRQKQREEEERKKLAEKK